MTDKGSDFAASARESRTGVVQDFWHFLRQNKKWWLLPIVVCLLVVGVLIVLGSTSLAPFIYTLF